jgi:hypothetical protein
LYPGVDAGGPGAAHDRAIVDVLEEDGKDPLVERTRDREHELMAVVQRLAEAQEDLQGLDAIGLVVPVRRGEGLDQASVDRVADQGEVPEVEPGRAVGGDEGRAQLSAGLRRGMREAEGVDDRGSRPFRGAGHRIGRPTDHVAGEPREVRRQVVAAREVGGDLVRQG